MNRSEDDLRAALQLAAQDHPAVVDVLPNRQPKRRTRAVLLPVAAAAAVVLAVGIPVYLVQNSHHDSARSDSASSAAAGLEVPGNRIPGGPMITAGPTASASSVPTGSGSSAPGAGTYPSAGYTCTAADVTLTLVWTHRQVTTQDGGLTGALTAKNTGGTACDLLVKPALVITGPDGQPVQNVASSEAQVGPQRLVPGASAISEITWSGWCGVSTDASVTASWGTGAVPVQVTGGDASVSSCGTGQNGGTISSTWFSPLS